MTMVGLFIIFAVVVYAIIAIFAMLCIYTIIQYSNIDEHDQFPNLKFRDGLIILLLGALWPIIIIVYIIGGCGWATIKDLIKVNRTYDNNG